MVKTINKRIIITDGDKVSERDTLRCGSIYLSKDVINDTNYECQITNIVDQDSEFAEIDLENYIVTIGMEMYRVTYLDFYVDLMSSEAYSPIFKTQTTRFYISKYESHVGVFGSLMEAANKFKLDENKNLVYPKTKYFDFSKMNNKSNVLYVNPKGYLGNHIESIATSIDRYELMKKIIDKFEEVNSITSNHTEIVATLSRLSYKEFRDNRYKVELAGIKDRFTIV